MPHFRPKLPEVGFSIGPYPSADIRFSGDAQRYVSREAAKECSPRRKPWGSATKPKQALEGRKRLIPDVALVISHVVLLEERKELFLKRVFLVMLFLPGNIFRDRRDMRFAHAEHTVAGLPCEL